MTDMEKELQKKMEEKGYGDLTKYQKGCELKSYFGTPPSFQNALKKIMEMDEPRKKANGANKVNSILKLLPQLMPSKEDYVKFREQQKEWNQKRNTFYQKRDNSVDNGLEELMKRCMDKQKQWQENKGKDKELKYLTEYMMCMFYIWMPDYIGRSVEFRNLQIKKEGTSKDQNYLTPSKMVMGIYKLSAKKEEDGTITKLKSGVITVDLPEVFKPIINRLRRITKQKYVFGGDDMMSQSGFHFMQKRVLGYATNDLRKMMAQHREGITKKKLYDLSVKMGNTLGTLLKHYV